MIGAAEAIMSASMTRPPLAFVAPAMMTLVLFAGEPARAMPGPESALPRAGLGTIAGEPAGSATWARLDGARKARQTVLCARAGRPDGHRCAAASKKAKRAAPRKHGPRMAAVTPAAYAYPQRGIPLAGGRRLLICFYFVFCF
jgi:hypothetical protein